MLRLCLIFCVLIFFPTALTARDYLDVDGVPRAFLTAAPIKRGAPAVIVLHGGGGKPEWARYRSGTFGLKDWAVIYPAATGARRWNDGRVGPDERSLGTTRDVAFLNALLDHLIREGADPFRLFLVGDSNGGMMTIRMVCEAGQRLAGAAVLIGNFPVGLDCPNKAPLPMIFFHGTADTVTPFAGGAVAKNGAQLGHILSARDTLNLFATRNGCNGYQDWQMQDRDPNDAMHVVRRLFSGCERRLEQYLIIGGGHSWPGRPHDDPDIEARFGPTIRTLDADNVVAQFFKSIADGG